MSNARTTDMMRELARAGGPLDYGPARSRLLVRLMRRLARGRPIAGEQVDHLGADVGLTRDEARQFLQRVAERDAAGAVTGILGLSLNDSPHRLAVDGVRLAAWCAGDTLFLPAMLGRTATIESASPVTGGPIRLTVSPQGIERVSPADAVVSMVIVAPDAADMSSVEAIWGTFCHHIYFFASRAEADQWAAGRDDIEILSVAEAYQVVQQVASSLLAHGE
jgi:alkylmercury lyase